MAPLAPFRAHLRVRREAFLELLDSLSRTQVNRGKRGRAGPAKEPSAAFSSNDEGRGIRLGVPRPSSEAMALPLCLPLGRFQERERHIRLTPPCPVGALDVLLNYKVALQDIQVWGLAVA